MPFEHRLGLAFGFPVPTSLTADANVPYRADLDSIRGGQAVGAVGYKNHHFGRGQHALFRSSWEAGGKTMGTFGFRLPSYANNSPGIVGRW